MLSSIGVGWACLFLCTCVLPWHALVASRRPTTSGSVRIGASAAAVEGRPWVGVTMIPEVFWAQRGEGDWLTGWMLCRMNSGGVVRSLHPRSPSYSSSCRR